MNILYYTNYPAPYRVEFFNELAKTENVTVVFDYKVNKKRDKKWFNSKYNFNFKKLKRFDLINIIKILKAKKYDIVVIGTYANVNAALFMFVLKLKKIKFFINADGGFVAQRESFVSKFLKTFFISKATWYLSTGKATNKYLEYYGANKDNIFIYPFSSLNKNDILAKPLNLKEKDDLKSKYNIKGKKVLLSVGQFIYRKGYDIFLEALSNKNYKDTIFVLISGGEEKDNYIKYMEENNINNVLLIDFCEKQKLKDYYKLADAYFFPSREDIWGLVINEAMAYGLPIISSNNVLASLELLDKKYLYDYKDTKQLTKKLDMLLNLSDKEKEKIGNDNINKIKYYTIENMAKVHVDIFEKVLKNEKN